MKLANTNSAADLPICWPASLVEPVVDAAVDAALGLLFGGLPEAGEVVRDVGQPARLLPRRRDRHVVGAEGELQGAGGAGADVAMLPAYDG